MSAVAQEIVLNPADVARSLNISFQYVADRLPTEIKHASPDDIFTLSAIEGVGELWSKYDGCRPDRTGQAISEYIMKIGMVLYNPDQPVEIVKEFGLTYQTLHREGPLDDMDTLYADDVAELPMPLSEVVFAAHSLRKEFGKLYRRRTHNIGDTLLMPSRQVPPEQRYRVSTLEP